MDKSKVNELAEEEIKLQELYKQKGEIITNIELFQSRLQIVNQEIAKELGILRKDANIN